MKKAVAIVMVMTMLMMSVCLPCGAAVKPDEPITPQWDNISHMISDLTFDGLNGCAIGSTFMKSGCQRMEATMIVYGYVDGEWQYADSRYKSESVGTLGIAVDFTGVSGREYRADFHVTIYRDGVGESCVKTVYETCP